MSLNRVIGANNRIPWHLSEDFKWFKQMTTGQVIVMGRKTFESILATLGKPLPGRTSLVISRNPDYQPAGLDAQARAALLLADSPTAALAALARLPTVPDEAFVIGGAEIYRALQPVADRMLVTEISQDFAGDAFFPAIDPHLWAETRREKQPRGGEPAVDFDFVEYQRIL